MKSSESTPTRSAALQPKTFEKQSLEDARVCSPQLLCTTQWEEKAIILRLVSFAIITNRSDVIPFYGVRKQFPSKFFENSLSWCKEQLYLSLHT